MYKWGCVLVCCVLAGLLSCGVSDPSASAPSATGGDACGGKAIAIPVGDGRLFVDRSPVTVAQFEVFATAASYVTEAETFGNAGVFDVDARAWQLVEGAFWRQPFGKTAGDAPADHPVTQVSYRDATAYCAHYGKRLPSDAEWSAAAAYGQPAAQHEYPWGDGIRDERGSFRANIWQGIFPTVQHVEDGYAYTSPVGAYGEHPSGLVDMAGNVWEWTTDTVDGVRVPGDQTHYLTKGGSFLCEPGWCHGYLVTGSSHTSAETGLFHTGFRCVCDGG